MSKLVRFDPFAEMDALQRHFFNDDNWMPRQIRSVGLPTTDVYMKDNALVVEVHLPKFDEDDVNISVENGNLVIQAQRHEKEEDKEKKYVVRESSSSFYRSVQLPERADADAIEAHLESFFGFFAAERAAQKAVVFGRCFYIDCYKIGACCIFYS